MSLARLGFGRQADGKSRLITFVSDPHCAIGYLGLPLGPEMEASHLSMV